MFELIDFLIVRPIINILFVIYNFVGDFGLAIILFTIIVKFITWPLMKRQLHQSKLMKKIQPELTEIRKRCNGNKQMESLQMMDLYKRNNIKPMASIWTLLIQVPIFFALFLAIRVMVSPTPSDNLSTRAYPPIAEMAKIHEVTELQKTYLENPKEKTYDFKPELFGTVDLSERAGTANLSQWIVLGFAIMASVIQYFTSKQLQGNNKKKGSFRKMMADAKEGKEPDQAELNNMVSGQMSIMMPLMMLMITINLPGALCFYYMLSNLISNIQQHYIMNKVDDELDDNTDRAILKELKQKTKQIKEAEVIENKKTGTRITRITAKDTKNKNSKKSKKSQSGKG